MRTRQDDGGVRELNDGSDDVVLVDQAGNPVGRHARKTVHSNCTPRHLAFSCWIYRFDGAVLITRRTLTKQAWPGVWTNSCCGHPRPGESLETAVHRRVREELGLTLIDLECRLPRFSYRAVDSHGTMENEFCPVFGASLDESTQIDPNPAEVMDWAWTDPAAVTAAMDAAPYAFSPWSTLQASQLNLTAVSPHRTGERRP